MRIYVSGPLSAETESFQLTNLVAAEDAGLDLMAMGHTAFVPHLSAYLDTRARFRGMLIGYSDWMRVDLDWLALCDGLLFLGSSPGADRELAFAKEHGLQIFYSLKEVPVVLNIIGGEVYAQ